MFTATVTLLFKFLTMRSLRLSPIGIKSTYSIVTACEPAKSLIQHVPTKIHMYHLSIKMAIISTTFTKVTHTYYFCGHMNFFRPLSRPRTPCITFNVEMTSWRLSCFDNLMFLSKIWVFCDGILTCKHRHMLAQVPFFTIVA